MYLCISLATNHIILVTFSLMALFAIGTDVCKRVQGYKKSSKHILLSPKYNSGYWFCQNFCCHSIFREFSNDLSIILTPVGATLINNVRNQEISVNVGVLSSLLHVSPQKDWVSDVNSVNKSAFASPHRWSPRRIYICVYINNRGRARLHLELGVVLHARAHAGVTIPSPRAAAEQTLN